MRLVIGTVLFFALAARAQVDLPVKVDAYIKTAISQDRGTYERLRLQMVDMNEVLHLDLPSGIGYGATAEKIINKPFIEVKRQIEKPGGLNDLFTSVKTMGDFHKVSEGPGQLRSAMSIIVPIVAALHVEAEARIIPDDKGREIIIWKQVAPSPDLEYTEGAMVCEPQGEKTNVWVIGTHFLKPEKRVPWIGRGTAAGFAKTHYGNFVIALEKVLEAPAAAKDPHP